MASLRERRKIGDEVVLTVRSTGSGVKVVELDGTGLRDGLLTKRHRRYFYGDEAADKAAEYAERVAENIREKRGERAVVVELGEKTHVKLAEVNEDD